jgi:hypothetical protein
MPRFCLKRVFEKQLSVLFSVGGLRMLGRFPRLSRLATKTLEIAAAGSASAFVAFLLGNSREPPRPPAIEVPAVVHLAPADEQMIRHVRDEGAALVQELRSVSDARNAAGSAVPAAAAQRPPKAATAPARREQKPSRAQTAETRASPPAVNVAAPPAQEVLRAPAPASQDPARVPAPGWARDDARAAMAAAPAAPAATASPTQVPSRLWPTVASSVRDAPRPPVGIGEFQSSSM